MVEEATRDVVLVVDDAPKTLSFLTDTLHRAGLTALVANDGESALRLVEKVTPDLVLMDAAMPGIGGFEACRRLKSNKRLEYIPVIFMTGLTETENVLEGLQAGGIDYVHKPVVIDELLARIDVHLRNARAAYRNQLVLDTTGSMLLSMSTEGRLLWCTAWARELLSTLFPDEGEAGMPEDLRADLAALSTTLPGPSAVIKRTFGSRALEMTFIGRLASHEMLFRLVETREGHEVEILQQALGLTRRQAEVLLWLSHGKQNRDISEILSISPRTVSKHLEQIFETLGVETRASATALAVRAIAGEPVGSLMAS